jgi:hypothetical protein
MKKLTILIALVALSGFAFQAAFSQAAAPQVLQLAVNHVQKFAVTNAGAIALTINADVNGAGDTVLTAVSDNSTKYSQTHNGATDLRITAGIDAGEQLPAGYKLEIALASDKGTSQGTVDISNATSAVDVVKDIKIGADKNKDITYTFSAEFWAGELTTKTEHVTLTLQN